MARLSRIFDKLDSVLSWWERLAKISWVWMGVSTVTFYLGSLWAGLTEQPFIIHITISLAVAASCTILFTFLPPLLRKLSRPFFEVLVRDMLSSKESIQMRLSIVNRSKNRMVLEFAVCVQAKSGKQIWFLSPDTQGLTSRLDAEDKTEGMIICSYAGRRDGLELPTSPEVFLQVTDRISTQRVYFKVPGSYPPYPKS